MILSIDKILTVDPGLTTAWAYWNDTITPEVGEFKCPRRLNQIERIDFMAKQFYAVLMRFVPQCVVIEMVEMWGGLKSRTAAVRGDTFNSALLIGAYTIRARDAGANVILLTAREWKGQLSKDATAWRVKKINGQTYDSEHITDAVAIGLSITNLWEFR